MTVQLSLSEVQVAVADYLRKRGFIVDDADKIHIEVRRDDGARLSIAGTTLVVTAYGVKPPSAEGPYR